MAKEITMPKLSDTMEEGKLLRWLKSEGDRVERGEVIAEVETDKADMEMEAFDEGVLLAITVRAGDSAAVGDVIGWIGAPGEEPAAAGGNGEPARGRTAAAADEAPAIEEAGAEARPAPRAPAARRSPAPGPRAEDGDRTAPKPAGERAVSQRRASRPGAANAELPGPHADIADVIDPEGGAEGEEGEEGPSRQAPEGRRAARRGRPTKGLNDRLPPVREPRAREERQKVSPVARKLALEAGIELGGLEGSGPDGRIVRADVERALAERPAATAAAPAGRPRDAERQPVPVASGRLGEEVPHTKIRRAIAARMAESKRTVPHFYTTAAVRMDEALRLKDALALRDPTSRVSVSHLIVKAAALALERHPRVAASFEEDRIRIPARIDVGLAVAVEDGLVVPVLRDVARKPLLDVAREARALVERVRGGRLGQDDLKGAVFSISNMGMFEIEQFSAIIAPPQSAILAIGGTADEPVVRDGSVVPGKVMRVTLSADHRVVDGVLAAAYVVEVKRLLENPLSLVL